MSFCRSARNRRFAFARMATPLSRVTDRAGKVLDEACVMYIPLGLELRPNS
jgi:hypothetical protein